MLNRRADCECEASENDQSRGLLSTAPRRRAQDRGPQRVRRARDHRSPARPKGGCADVSNDPVALRGGRASGFRTTLPIGRMTRRVRSAGRRYAGASRSRGTRGRTAMGCSTSRGAPQSCGQRRRPTHGARDLDDARRRGDSCRARSSAAAVIRRVTYPIPLSSPELGLQSTAVDACVSKSKARLPPPPAAVDHGAKPGLDERAQRRSVPGRDLLRLGEERRGNVDRRFRHSPRIRASSIYCQDVP